MQTIEEQLAADHGKAFDRVIARGHHRAPFVLPRIAQIDLQDARPGRFPVGLDQQEGSGELGIEPRVDTRD